MADKALICTISTCALCSYALASFVLYNCKESSTNSTFFMQNEPNFRKVK
jgi:hypothetical protein